ncbi:DUF2252 domain-containing protein [Urbifossiella limnaea]|uniref:DUF2252 domain-containing protein n=1 Tax=Urbifossiella limnaea TaxID=2528023 RepID=A0A517XT11_9BACT|nr:DUF2252 domain-containing protein [Urbifossiella limnaea]QDU20669.1 hypothetical protein ETAA1_26260 [Urbifossiella limnaea]
MGKSLRDKCPRESHAAWRPAADRPDPLALLEESNKGRMPHLVPVRHGRMLHSPFTFYRGAALNMAADLAGTPSTGLRVQACGDCHLCNFGAYATPERRVIFDLNDLDETLPAPWEWDVKRLAASFVLACRDNGFREDAARDAALSCVRSYRERMAEYGDMRVLDVWYASIDVEKLLAVIDDREASRRLRKRLAKARERSVLEHDFPELATDAGPAPTIRDNPPLIFHPPDRAREELMASAEKHFAGYRASLREDRRLLLDRFVLKDAAAKVVGVGSVGTYCAVLLLMAGEHDPLFLQVKQARPSVLEPYAGKDPHANHGERVVHGCRMLQSASDTFLGWVKGEAGRHYYVRQLRDMKIKPVVEAFTPGVMVQYADFCGWALAHAHARSGEPAAISGYLGKGDKFDEAVADFAAAYADQSERDHEILVKAARAGKLEVVVEEGR